MFNGIPTLSDLDLRGKTVMIRTEFNVPLTDDGVVADATRIRAAIPTIAEVIGEGAAVVLLSHRGRPWGERTSEDSLKVLAPVLSEYLGVPVDFVPECAGPERDRMVGSLKPGNVLLLENVRYHIEENESVEAFAKELANGIDVYINDAWGNCHRPHTSMTLVPRLVPERAAGRLVEREYRALSDALEGSASPKVLVLGGSKAAGKDGKLHIIEHAIDRMDTVLVGGRVALYLLAAQEMIPLALLEDRSGTDAQAISTVEQVELAAKVLSKADRANCHIGLPQDGMTIGEDGAAVSIALADLRPDTPFLDIGPHTSQVFARYIEAASTVIWNGPMGAFELPGFELGTVTIARAVAQSEASSLVGGGDSVRALTDLGLADQVDHVSTGGGVVLTFLMGGELPGLQALRA